MPFQEIVDLLRRVKITTIRIISAIANRYVPKNRRMIYRSMICNLRLPSSFSTFFPITAFVPV